VVGGGVNGAISAMASGGRHLYVVGSFTSAGGVAATNAATWDGSQWSGMGDGLQGYPALATASGHDVYVLRHRIVSGSGTRTEVVRWDGHVWNTVVTVEGLTGSRGFGYITALAARGPNIYVAGEFNQVAGVTANNIAKWDGDRWSALGSGLTGDVDFQPNFFLATYVSALAVHGSYLYAGGSFNRADGKPAANIARWDGNSWHPLGDGLGSQGYFFSFGADGFYNPVESISVNGPEVFAGGQFLQAFGAPADRLARWDGSRWSAVDGGVDSDVLALDAEGQDLFVGGKFTIAGATPSRGFAIWHGARRPK